VLAKVQGAVRHDMRGACVHFAGRQAVCKSRVDRNYGTIRQHESRQERERAAKVCRERERRERWSACGLLRSAGFFLLLESGKAWKCAESEAAPGTCAQTLLLVGEDHIGCAPV